MYISPFPLRSTNHPSTHTGHAKDMPTDLHHSFSDARMSTGVCFPSTYVRRTLNKDIHEI